MHAGVRNIQARRHIPPGLSFLARAGSLTYTRSWRSRIARARARVRWTSCLNRQGFHSKNLLNIHHAAGLRYAMHSNRSALKQREPRSKRENCRRIIIRLLRVRDPSRLILFEFFRIAAEMLNFIADRIFAVSTLKKTCGYHACICNVCNN